MASARVTVRAMVRAAAGLTADGALEFAAEVPTEWALASGGLDKRFDMMVSGRIGSARRASGPR
jgi:hypothetical protein